MFYEQLLLICEKNNIKISPLLSELKISTGNITSWANGTLPNGKQLIAIADKLDCSIDYLLGRTDDSTSPNKKAPAILEKAEALKILAADKLGHEPTKEDLQRLEELTEVVFKKFE